MGQACSHLAEALQISFQRHLFAQTRYFSDVGNHTKRATRAGIRRRIDRRDRGAQTFVALSVIYSFDLFPAKELTAGKRCFDHICQGRKLSKNNAEVLTLCTSLVL